MVKSHKAIECKKPALQAKNKTLMTETMEEESDVATFQCSSIPVQYRNDERHLDD